MAAKVDLEEYLRGETGVENALRVLLTKLDWTESKPPYRGVVKFYAPGSTGWTQAAEIKVAKKEVMDVATFMAELERQIADTLGPNPIGKLVFIFKGSGEGSELVHRQRNVEPADAGTGNMSIELVLRLLNEANNKVNHLTTQQQAAYQAAQGTIVAQSQAIAALATQRTVSSSAADAGGLAGLVGLVGIVFAYPFLKDRLGLPKDATVEDTVRALQLGTARLIGVSERDAAAERGEAPPIPAGAMDPAAPKQIAEAVTPVDLDAIDVAGLTAALKSSPEKRDALLSKLLADPDIQKAATLAFVRSQS